MAINPKLELSKEEMTAYGYKVVDEIVDHFKNIPNKSPVFNATREAIDYNIELAEKTEAYLRKSPNWEIVSPAHLAILNFRYNSIHEKLSEKELDKLNQRIYKEIIRSKEAHLVTTILNGQVVLRMCLINPRTTFEDIKQTITKCEEIANDYLNQKI